MGSDDSIDTGDTVEISSNRREILQQIEDRKVQEAISNIADEPEQIDAIAEVRFWFGGPNGSIQDYLNDKTDFTEASDEIFGSLNLLYSIWHEAKRTSFRDTERHLKLAELLKLIFHREEHRNEFGLVTREVWNDSPGRATGYSEPEIHAWANANFFAALLTKERIHQLWLYSIWAMRPALEEEHKDDREGTALQKYNVHTPAAAVWVLVLGKSLYERELDMTAKHPNHGEPAKGGELWKGKPEFSKRRWAFWKKRFEEISQMEGLSKETQEIAKEAYEAMNQAERTSSGARN